MSSLRSCPWAALVASALLLGACGGGQAPAPSAPVVSLPLVAAPAVAPTTYSMAPPDQAALPAGAPVVVRFSAAMDTGSLALDSDFARQATASWSSSTHTNDTLTLSPPPGGWLGHGPLRFSANDAQGRALTAEASYDVTVLLQTFQAASAVIGQPDFSSDAQNAGGAVSARTLNSPSGKTAIGPQGELFVADTMNHRVLRYTLPPPTANAAANLVLGQAGFDQDTMQTSREGLGQPSDVAILGTRLAVADSGNHRVLLWNTLPTASGTPADVVIGQADFNSSTSACDARGFAYSVRVAFSPDGKLLVVDEDNNRVLVWNQVPTANGTPADLVIGQSGFERCTANDDNQDGVFDAQTSARTLLYPGDVWTDGQRLVVSDSGNNRVLIWNHFPTTHFQPADLVLGQSDFAHWMDNDDNQDGARDGTPSARTLNSPASAHSNGVQLVVADYDNNRVLIWDRFPTTSFQPADRVLGQSNFTLKAYNDSDQDGQDDLPSAHTASGPAGALLHGQYLVVTLDGHGGNRVLVFQSSP
jgi:WD40 repeat protein